jgi:hypothetical protein
MAAAIELNPEIAKQILNNAKSKGLSVEVYLHEIIEAKKEDRRLSVMREAARDRLFLSDLAETTKDFRHTDFE